MRCFMVQTKERKRTIAGNSSCVKAVTSRESEMQFLDHEADPRISILSRRRRRTNTKIEVERRLSFPVLWLSAHLLFSAIAAKHVFEIVNLWRFLKLDLKKSTTLNNRLKTVNASPEKKLREFPLIHSFVVWSFLRQASSVIIIVDADLKTFFYSPVVSNLLDWSGTRWTFSLVSLPMEPAIKVVHFYGHRFDRSKGNFTIIIHHCQGNSFEDKIDNIAKF